MDNRSQADSARPPGVWMPAMFFAVAGVLDFAVSGFASGHPPRFDDAWTASGRLILNVLLAAGLWNRIWLCRPIALIYCIAAITAYSTAILLAVTGQPLAFPPSIVVSSVFEVPLCVVVYRWLRSPEAGRLFSRPLF